jgi:hypothetical protein
MVKRYIVNDVSIEMLEMLIYVFKAMSCSGIHIGVLLFQCIAQFIGCNLQSTRSLLFLQILYHKMFYTLIPLAPGAGIVPLNFCV